jgi:hypothetical protein
MAPPVRFAMPSPVVGQRRADGHGRKSDTAEICFHPRRQVLRPHPSSAVSPVAAETARYLRTARI